MPATPTRERTRARSTDFSAMSSCSSIHAIARSWSAAGTPPAGSTCVKNFSVTRTAPMSIEIACLTLVEPRTSSVEPPPMSTTSIGPGSDSPSPPTAPRKDSDASCVPTTTSGSTPMTALIWRTNSALLDASRVAEVATKRMLVAPSFSIIRWYSTVASTAREIAAGSRYPRASTPCPRRTMRIWRVRSAR